jgi:hypothetical protein
MKSFRLFREVDGPPEVLYHALVRVLQDAGTRAEPPLFVHVAASADGPAESVPVEVRAVSVAGIVNLRLKAHVTGGDFPFFQGTLETVESKGRGRCVRMRGTYLVPLARGREQRSLQARRRAEAMLESFLETLIDQAARVSVA